MIDIIIVKIEFQIHCCFLVTKGNKFIPNNYLRVQDFIGRYRIKNNLLILRLLFPMTCNDTTNYRTGVTPMLYKVFLFGLIKFKVGDDEMTSILYLSSGLVIPFKPYKNNSETFRHSVTLTHHLMYTWHQYYKLNKKNIKQKS